jgi:hypothetical protein
VEEAEEVAAQGEESEQAPGEDIPEAEIIADEELVEEPATELEDEAPPEPDADVEEPSEGEPETNSEQS